MLNREQAPSVSHSSHWGSYLARRQGEGVAVLPAPDDPDPSLLLANIADSARHPTRVPSPMVRRGWLEGGGGRGEGRGREPFVPVSWDVALELVSEELSRVRRDHGPEAIYGGSYGWASAGRFHHAQSQLHRFLNLAGGYTRSVNTYSSGAGAVILPHVVGSEYEATRDWITWDVIADHTELVVAFGGLAIKNASVSSGGISRHAERDELRRAGRRGCRFVVVSPLRDDLISDLDAEWIAPRPATDTAIMLSLAHSLLSAGLHDRAFLRSHTVGYERFERYLLGASDGVPKSAQWAEGISGVPAERITALAARMAGHRTLLTLSYSLQRAEHGEQPIWMGVVLAAMLGQIGLDGGGFAYALGGFGNSGRPRLSVAVPALPQGRRPVDSFIPVARLADMLLNPGGLYDYDGQQRTYPHIRLVYWAGGNPFHHHQDLNRLRRAWSRPETVVVHEPFWTATARHADIILPITVTLERDDIGGAVNDSRLVAMHQVLEPYGESRDDYWAFAELAQRLGFWSEFTEERSPGQWLRHLYLQLEQELAQRDIYIPGFEEFWRLGHVDLPVRQDAGHPLREFRSNPAEHPLPTPSGRIEIYSQTVAAFGYPDCPGHPAWLEPDEWLGSSLAKRFPLQLVANQPATRLHSQLDMGAHSRASKIHGREPVRMNPADAAKRGIQAGDVVRIFNDRGACLAGAVLSDQLRRGVVQLSTGAWYDPLDPREAQTPCVHGNPNVLTRDVGTSRLGQGCSGQLALVEIARHDEPLPPLRSHLPPPTVDLPDG